MENVFADLPASEQKNIFSDLPQKKESGLWATAKNAGGSILGAAEAIGTNIINIPTAAVAGLQGIGATIGNLAGGGNFEDSMAQGTKAIEDYQATHGYVPETEWGKKYTGIVETPIQKVISEPSTQLGQIYTDITGSPAVGAVVKTIYEMAGMGILFGSPKMIAGLRAKGVPPELIKAGFEKVKMDNFKPTSEDVAVGKDRIAGWKKTDEILARTPQRGRFVFEDLPTELPVEPTSKIYADTMGGKEAGMQGIIETLQKQGMPTERVNEIIKEIYPEQELDFVEGAKKAETKMPTPEEIEASRTNQTLPEGQKAWDVTLPTAEEAKGYGGVQNKPIETMTVPEITEKINFYNNLKKGEMSEANRAFIRRTVGKLQDAYLSKTGKSIVPESLPQSNILYKEYKGVSPLEVPPENIARGAQVNVMGGGPTFEASKGATARTPSGKENPLPPNYSEKQSSTLPPVEQKASEPPITPDNPGRIVTEKATVDEMAGGEGTTLYSNPLPQALSGLQNVASSILRPILKLAEGETVKHGIIRKLQDTQRRILEYERTNQITPGKSTYKLEERTKSMIANALSEVDNIQKLWVNSVVGKLGKFDTGLKEVSDYVYAKFSQQRNTTVEARRAKLIADGKEVVGEYGSGMTNAEAQAILDKAKADGKTAKYEELAKPIWELGKSMRELMEKEGLIDAETAKAWEVDGGPFYVTLQGGVEKPNVMPGSSGLRQGAGIKNYVGRRSMADDPVTNMFRQYKNIVVRSMENNVKKSFGEIAANDPNITMNEWRSKMKYDSDTGMVKPVSEPPWMSTDPAIRENTVSFLKDGKQMYMTFKDDPLLARALNDVGVGQIGPILKASRAAVKIIGMTKTSISPEFLITNAGCRDLLDAVHSIGVEMDLKTARRTLKTIPNGIVSSYRAAKGRLDLSDPTSMDTSAKIFKENGGPTGYYSLRDFEGELKTMEQIASRVGEGAKPMALRSWDKVTDFVQDISESTENGVRLALFHELRMQKVPINEAISAAKNVTVNFNKMGEWGKHMKALYMFSNPAVQGAKRMIDLASTKRGAVVGAGIFGTGLALMELNRYNAGIDENGINNFDKLSQSEKTRNLILWPPGAKEPLKFPLGFYHRPYFGLASSIDSAINDPMKTTGGAALDVVNNMIDAFNPLGGGSVTSVVPTLIKPAFEVATNYSWSGAPIHPELMPGETKARSEKYFQSATEASKGAASFLNAKTGGDKFESGDISISPNTIDYVSNFFLGDPAVTMARLTDMAAKYYKGESIETPKIPIVRRFAGASTDYALPKWFNEAAAVNKPQYAREKEIFDQADIAEEDRAYTPKAEMGKLATRFSREYGELNKLYKEVKETDISKMEGITRDRKAEVMTDLKKQMQDLLGAYVKTHIELKKQPMQKEMQKEMQ
jgi:hypothetical protein